MSHRVAPKNAPFYARDGNEPFGLGLDRITDDVIIYCDIITKLPFNKIIKPV